jgi:hypothetical protein
VGGTRARDGAQGFNLVHVYENTILHTVVPIGTYSTTSYTSAEETARILERENVVIRPAKPTAIPIDPVLTVPQLLPQEVPISS